MAAKNEKTFLGKSGQVFGPFNSQELDALRSKGQLSQYSWIWDHSAETWKPLEMPPPSPYASQAGTSGSGSKDWDWNRVEALCHDHSRVVSGTLAQVTQTGCDLVSDSPQPVWVNRQVVNLNLYDPKTQKTRRFETQVAEVVRGEKGGWVYRLRWEAGAAL